MSGRYISTLGTFKPWTPILPNIPVQNYFTNYQLPPEVKKSASFTTVKVAKKNFNYFFKNSNFKEYCCFFLFIKIINSLVKILKVLQGGMKLEKEKWEKVELIKKLTDEKNMFLDRQLQSLSLETDDKSNQSININENILDNSTGYVSLKLFLFLKQKGKKIKISPIFIFFHLKVY